MVDGNRTAALPDITSASKKTSKPRTRSQLDQETKDETGRLMAKDASDVRRRIAFDAETYLALDRLAKDRMVEPAGAGGRSVS